MKLKKSKLIAIISFIAIFTQIMPSYAGTSTGSFVTNSTLVSSCQISATNLNFGTIPADSSYTGVTSNISINCSNKVNYTVAINLGSKGVTDGYYQNILYMSGNKTTNNDTIPYHICAVYGFNVSSGCQVQTFTNRAGVGTGATQSLVLWGYALDGYYTPDTYSDSIVVTLSY